MLNVKPGLTSHVVLLNFATDKYSKASGEIIFVLLQANFYVFF